MSGRKRHRLIGRPVAGREHRFRRLRAANMNHIVSVFGVPWSFMPRNVIPRSFFGITPDFAQAILRQGGFDVMGGVPLIVSEPP